MEPFMRLDQVDGQTARAAAIGDAQIETGLCGSARRSREPAFHQKLRALKSIGHNRIPHLEFYLMVFDDRWAATTPDNKWLSSWITLVTGAFRTRIAWAGAAYPRGSFPSTSSP